MNHPFKKRAFSCPELSLPPFPSFSVQSLRAPETIKSRPIKIKSTICHGNCEGLSMEPFLFYMENIIHKMLPSEILEDLSLPQNFRKKEHALSVLFEQLPLISWSPLSDTPAPFCVSLLCPADFTQGIGRHFTDTMSRWLVPGKFQTVFSAHSLNFHFENAPSHKLFIHQIVMDIHDQKELALIKTNLPKLSREIKIKVSAVKQARQIMASTQLSQSQKRAIIEESISSLIDRPSKEIDSNIFDQMHHFLIKLAGEDQEAKMMAGFDSLMTKKPNLLDRDIFNEIRPFVLLFKDKFSALHKLRHLGRIISYQYLFRKTLQRQIREAPLERFLHFKLFQARLAFGKSHKNVLSLLVAINILEDNELLGERHILAALNACLPGVQKVPDSFVVDQRNSDKIRIFYLEVEKSEGAPFNLPELKKLKTSLPRELKGKIENVIHPVLLSRNEEEVMRNIVLLTRELKLVNDLPQVYISFDAQVGENLSFTVILLRLLHKKHRPLKQICSKASTPLTFFDFETKQTGFLRKKYPKEANVFRVELDKTPFLRKDFSLDLYKARLVVSTELARILGEIRDFNGGILSKEQEALLAFKRALKGIEKGNDFLSENFFYSISPPVMRSIVYTTHLCKLYLMMLTSLEHNYSDAPLYSQTTFEAEYALFMLATPYGDFKEPICDALANFAIDPLDLSYTCLNAYGIGCFGIVVRCEDIQKKDTLYQTLQLTLLEAINKLSSEKTN